MQKRFTLFLKLCQVHSKNKVKNFRIVNNQTMREIVYGLEHAKRRAERLRGVLVRIRINKGRNKFIDKTGKICDLFPAVFTFCSENETLTFSYSDLLTKMVKIFPIES